MTVALLPPTTNSLDNHHGESPLSEGPRFVRTRGMSRWHRPRSGIAYTTGRIVYGLWCGASVGSSERAGQYLAMDSLPPDEPVCATCDGRAVGAGQEQQPADRQLVFGPRSLARPARCPASRTGLFTEMPGGRVGRCLACLELHPLRAMGGPYNPRYAITQHPPGASLVAPCPFHGWRRLTRAANDQIACECGRPTPAEENR
ncbi:hypothetical protein ACIQXD_04945 [Streptomyces uncialis]|uniref:hypothetical protein n=1 Tax=Streptomyces uncialis TaxID=1048205 RepID=UPI0038050F9A